MLHTVRFFLSSKCSLFHNSNIFGSCFIHILYTECAKIKKKKFRRQTVNKHWLGNSNRKKLTCCILFSFLVLPPPKRMCLNPFIPCSHCNNSTNISLPVLGTLLKNTTWSLSSGISIPRLNSAKDLVTLLNDDVNIGKLPLVLVTTCRSWFMDFRTINITVPAQEMTITRTSNFR